MSDAYHQLLDATIQHLEGLKARGVRFVPVQPASLQLWLVRRLARHRRGQVLRVRLFRGCPQTGGVQGSGGVAFFCAR